MTTFLAIPLAFFFFEKKETPNTAPSFQAYLCLFQANFSVIYRHATFVYAHDDFWQLRPLPLSPFSVLIEWASTSLFLLVGRTRSFFSKS